MIVIHQDENNLGINDENITLTGISSPVTLNIADSNVNSVFGLSGGIAGLEDATVSNFTTATINGKYFDISDTLAGVVVVGGDVPSIQGLNRDSTVKSAPDVKILTTGNGR